MYIFNNYIALNMLGPMRTLGEKKKEKQTQMKERRKKGQEERLHSRSVSDGEKMRSSSPQTGLWSYKAVQEEQAPRSSWKEGCKGDSRKGEDFIWNSFLPFFSHFIYLSTTHTQTQLIRTEHKRRAFSHDEHQ